MVKLIEMFRQGGPVMWPILALSIIGLAILIWKAMEFRTGRKDGRGLGIVSTIITAEPMLGILGTVTGIIKTFGSFKLAENTSPLAATAGIGEALITTAAGLIVAMPCAVCYNLFTRKIDDITSTIDAGLTDMMETVGEA